MTAWGVLVTESQRHKLAADELTSGGFEYFQPYRELVKVYRGRKVRTRVPYFGRYMFVALCDAWRQVVGLRGVSGILLDPSSLNPIRVDPRELQEVRDRCDRNGVIESPSAGSAFKYGDEVYVEEGPLAFMRGTYDGTVGKKREAAKFFLFGREQRVTFKVGELKLVGI